MNDALLMIVGITAFAIGLAVSIALHEVGHLVPAKAFGVKVSQYMVGFGRTLWSRRRGETEYGVKAVPLGGYVRMIGMFPPEPGGDPTKLRRNSTGPLQALIDDARDAAKEEIGPEDSGRVFYAKPWWKKLIVMLGGPFMNIVIAFCLALGVLTVHGVVDATDPRVDPVVSSVSQCVLPADESGRECRESDPATPAAAAGFQAGDRITSFENQPMRSWADVQEAIRNHGPGQATIVVERPVQDDVDDPAVVDGSTPTESVTLTPELISDERPRLDETGAQSPELGTVEVGFLGLSPVLTALPQSLGDSMAWIGNFMSETVQAVLRVPEKMVDVWNVAFNGAERGVDTPMSIVGAGRAGGEIAALEAPAADRVATFVMLLAGFNMAIAVFNLIPLLPLDGGHAIGALWEGVKRGFSRLTRRPAPRPVDVARALPLAYGVAGVLICMSLLLIYVDVVAPIPLFG
ncbi:MAG TPA: site-2 protease family protein [Jiangellaceae bacterium]|nr:site-2 protease family protein [Jiangellaceae bacterium]